MTSLAETVFLYPHARPRHINSFVPRNNYSAAHYSFCVSLFGYVAQLLLQHSMKQTNDSGDGSNSFFINASSRFVFKQKNTYFAKQLEPAVRLSQDDKISKPYQILKYQSQ